MEATPVSSFSASLSATGFRLAGFEVYPDADVAQLDALLDKLIGQRTPAFVVIDQQLAEAGSKRLEGAPRRRPHPAHPGAASHRAGQHAQRSMTTSSNCSASTETPHEQLPEKNQLQDLEARSWRAPKNWRRSSTTRPNRQRDIILRDAAERLHLAEEREVLVAKAEAERHFRRVTQASELKMQGRLDQLRWEMVQTVQSRLSRAHEGLARRPGLRAMACRDGARGGICCPKAI
jgi:hypothetical protein